jgi:uncharacterized protein YjbI with pentapeptide repeats
MLKAKYLYACLVAGSILSVPLMTDAKLGANGVSLNGTSLNGTSLNGTSLNGVSLNGTSLNGIDPKTNQISSAATNGTFHVEGGQLVVQTTSMAR